MKQSRCLILVMLMAIAMLLTAAAEPNEQLHTYTYTQENEYIVGSLNADSALQGYITFLSRQDSETPMVDIQRTAGTRLAKQSAQAYRLLLPPIYDVANGQRASTKFTFTLGELGLPKMLTATELHVSAISIDGELTEEAAVAVHEYALFDIAGIANAILSDCPYAMYWCDKTQAISATGASFSYDERGIYFNMEDTVTFSFPVIDAYAAAEYTFDVTVSQRVQNAVENAKQIVAQNAGLSDVEKLRAYKQKICELTSYNNEAAGGNVSYGDPWQLVWVFDGDPSTNVVCEGYAKAFQYLCDLSTFDNNVECYSASGTMNDGAHMWNLVRMPNDKVYIADITNSDSNTIGAGGNCS